MDTITKAVKCAIQRNNDGAGFALKRKNPLDKKRNILISKGFMGKDPSNLLTNICDQNIKKEDELIIHLRYTTSGEVHINNCHPFGIPDKENIGLIEVNNHNINFPVVAHNGTFYDFVEEKSLAGWNHYYADKEKKSDSYKFVEELLVNKNLLPIFVDKAKSKDFFFNSYILNNKLSLLFPDREMLLIGDFIEETDGMMYSNEYYKNPYTMIPLLNSVNKIMKTFKANTIRNSFRLADRLFINN